MTRNMHIFWQVVSTAMDMAAAKQKADDPQRPADKKLTAARIFASFMAKKK